MRQSLTRLFAIREGTRRYAQRAVDQGIPASAYRALGRTGLVASSIGFGGYRIDDRTPEHAAALDMALRGGVNLIDTSTNYTDGASESCIGNVLARHDREELIVVSKVGYVQGQALAMARSREQPGSAFPEMVKYTEGCWHCIHPEFLADQLERSLTRLRIETVDVYLLHNPEYFFTDATKKRPSVSLEALRDEFYDRIRRAFVHLEGEVAKGRIGCYGVSSNTFVVPTSNSEATSLERMWTIAGEVAREHHFAVVQLPANLFESGAMMIRNNVAGTTTALEFARGHDLAVLVNRPLNAFLGEELMRLADMPAREIAVTLEEQAAKVVGLEGECPGQYFKWGTELARAGMRVGSLHWRHIEAQVIAPQVAAQVKQTGAQLSGTARDEFQKWLERYLPELQTLLLVVENECAKRSQARSRDVHARVDPFLPLAYRAESLSRKALAVLTNTKGVTCVLNGMRHPNYVDDSLGALRSPPFDVDLCLYEAFNHL
jgi:aryl-alcohol dehydrogenase-like predicted oxidoreductase